MTEVRLAPLRRGDPRTIALTVVDLQGAPVDLSSASWAATARPLPNSVTEHDLTVDTTGAEQGILVIHMTGEQSRTFTSRVFGDVQGSNFGTILSWDTVMLSDVTRPEDEPTGGLVDSIMLTIGVTGATLSAQLLAILVPTGGTAQEHVHTQASAATTWTVNHNRGARPRIVQVFSVGGKKINGDILHTSDNQYLVLLNVAAAGTARSI